MKALKSLLFGLLLFIVVTFSLKNAGHVRFKYFGLIDSFEIPLFTLVIVSVLLGMVVGIVADLIKRGRLKKTIRKELKITDELQKQLIELRSRMLTGPKDGEGETADRDEDELA